jgi:hypothetical protein
MLLMDAGYQPAAGFAEGGGADEFHAGSLVQEGQFD